VSYILVAEDDPYIQLLVRRKLEGAGYEVRATPDGDEALSMALDSPPLLLLLDVMLPGQTGLSVCKAVKARFGDDSPPIIIISARGQQSDVEAGDRAGADDYLIKPFSPRDLLDHVQSFLRH
jgi:DNA-binding response OmpR family regulator